jgi:hypothetical protein
MHHPGDDDSAAVTFWGKQDLRTMLRMALERLDEHYSSRGHEPSPSTVKEQEPVGSQKAAELSQPGAALPARPIVKDSTVPEKP